MTYDKIVELGIAGTIITFVGTLISLFFKDYFLNDFFEKRRDKKTIDNIFKKYKDPISLSAIELSSRLVEIISNFPTVYLSNKVLNQKATYFTSNTIEDSHFKRHKLFSTIYRFSSFLGWLELYRQEITFLNSSNNKVNTELEYYLNKIRSALADGHLNENQDWENWIDFLIFKEEQRAIGENMIIFNQATKTIIGYGKFKTFMDSYLKNGENEWIGQCLNFFLDLNNSKDFRKERYFILIKHLKGLMSNLDVNPDHEVIIKIDKILTLNCR